MKATLAIFAAAGLALSATAAQAETVRVSYDDLNLESVAGQAALDQRIDKAAREVCGHKSGGTRNLRLDQSTRSCFEKAKASAGAQMAAHLDRQALGG